MRKEATEVQNTNHVLFETQGPREFKGCAAGQPNRRQTEGGIRSSPTSWRALSWKTNAGQHVLHLWEGLNSKETWRDAWKTPRYNYALLASPRWPHLQLYHLCTSCYKGFPSCLSLPLCLLLYLLPGRPAAETPPSTLRFSLPDILTGHSLAAALATLAHLRGNYTRAVVCCVNRSWRRFSQGTGCVVLGFSSLLSGAGLPPLFVNISNPFTLVCPKRTW